MKEKIRYLPDCEMKSAFQKVRFRPLTKGSGREFRTLCRTIKGFEKWYNICAKSSAEEQPDALAEQLSRINEQLAIKNRRAKRVWKAIAFIVGGIIAVYVLILILATVFTFSPDQSDTTDSSQSIESIVEKEWGLGDFISAVREYPVPQLLPPNFSVERFTKIWYNCIDSEQ